MFKKTILFALFALSLLAARAQNSEATAIEAGPMLGSVEMREAKLWLKTKPCAKVEVKVENQDKSSSLNFEAASDQDGICKIVLSNLKPSTVYNYVLTVEGQSESGTLKTIPDYKLRTPPPDFKVAVLGKTHRNDPLYDEPFKTPGGDYKIFESVANQKPDSIIWANNAASLLNADLASRSGMFERYLYNRADPALKNLLKAAPNYGVISISSFGENSADANMWNKRDAIEVFKKFWANPSFGVSDIENCATFFRLSDAEFFILDDVSDRNNFDYGEHRPQMLGRKQLDWLLASLKNSKATFKIVVANSPMLNPVEGEGNFAKYEKERKELLDFIVKNKIGGLVFVCANKSHGEITKLVRAGAHEIFELCAGPLTDRPAKSATEMNFYRVPGSTVLERSFAMLSVSGPENERVLELQFFSVDGKPLYSQKMKANELYQFD